MTSETNTVGLLLHARRKAKGLTLRALADKTGVPFTNISAFETGRLQPGELVMNKLADGLGLNVLERKRMLIAPHIPVGKVSDPQFEIHAIVVFSKLLPSVLAEAGIKSTAAFDYVFVAIPGARPSQSVIAAIEGGDPFSPTPALAPDLISFLKTAQSRSWLGIVFLQDGRQILIGCGGQIFGQRTQIGPSEMTTVD